MAGLVWSDPSSQAAMITSTPHHRTKADNKSASTCGWEVALPRETAGAQMPAPHTQQCDAGQIIYSVPQFSQFQTEDNCNVCLTRCRENLMSLFL